MANKTIKTVWELWTYDVWGNKQDGYEVNDRSCMAREYPINVKTQVNNKGTEREFISAYASDYQIQKAFGVSCKIDAGAGDDTHYEISRASDGLPIGQMFCTSHASLSPICES